MVTHVASSSSSLKRNHLGNLRHLDSPDLELREHDQGKEQEPDQEQEQEHEFENGYQYDQQLSSPGIPIDDSLINVETQFTQDVNVNLNSRHNNHTHHNSSYKKQKTMVPSFQFDNSPAQAGILLNLHLINFMCHSNFNLDFGSQTNFIVGRNGSGKSAVLTGLSVCLGAKANETDRGNSLKSLIMNGKTTARLSVTFKNEGEEAYEYDVFGKSIEIERVIKLQGLTSYKIKNHQGKVISTKKSKIDEILDYYGITINNPMTILTQTEAKTFLAHSTDQQKFKFFMDGTRLSESIENCKDIELKLKKVSERLVRSKIVLDESKIKLEKAKEIWIKFKDAEETKAKQKLLHGKRAWLEVFTLEENKTKAEKELQKHSTNLENLKIEISQSKISIADLQSKSEHVKDTIQMIEESSSRLDAERKEISENLQGLKNTENTLSNHLKLLQDNIASSQKELSDTEKSIRVEQTRLDEARGGGLERIKQLKEKHEKEFDNLNKQLSDQIKEVQLLKEEFKSRLDAIENSIKSTKKDKFAVEQSIKEIQQELKKSNKNNKFSGLPNPLRNAANRIIKESHAFNEPVEPPLSLKISMKSEYYKMWGPLIDTMYHKFMTSCVAQNFQDQKKLRSILDTTKCSTEIIKRRSETFDYSHDIPHYYPERNQITLLDVFQFEDKNIECLTVDQLRAHATLLIEDRKEAETMLYNDHSNKIFQIFSVQPAGYIKLTKNRAGTLNSDPVLIEKNAVSRFFIRQAGNDNDDGGLARSIDYLNSIKGDLNKFEQTKVSCLNEFAERESSLNAQIKEKESRMKDLRQFIRKAENKLTDDGSDGQLEALEEKKQQTLVQIHSDEQAVGELVKNLEKEAKKLESELNHLEALNDERRKLKQNREDLQRNLNDLENRIEEYKETLESQEASADRIENVLLVKITAYLERVPLYISDLQEKAVKFCSREDCRQFPECDTNERIEARLKELKASLEEIEERIGITEEQAKIDFVSQHQICKEASEKLTEASKLHNDLKKSLDSRVRNLKDSRQNTCFTVNEAFQSALKLRNFKGQLKFDFKEHKLSLHVSTEKHKELRKVESFSGGEKSFAQIAFLLAIWKPMHSKVRGLDEFDVFMDSVNRRMALKLILEKVAEHPKTQTIFITPLSINEVDGIDRSSVHIQEIADPRSGL